MPKPLTFAEALAQRRAKGAEGASELDALANRIIKQAAEELAAQAREMREGPPRKNDTRTLRERSWAVIEKGAAQLREASPSLSRALAIERFLETPDGQACAIAYEHGRRRGAPAEFSKEEAPVKKELSERDRIWLEIDDLAVARMRAVHDAGQPDFMKAQAIAVIVQEHPDLYRRWTRAKG